MDPDSTVGFPQPDDDEERKDVFRFGDETILRMQDKVFALDEFGTQMGNKAEPAADPIVSDAAEPGTSGDPLARIEQKLDQALCALEGLQRRVDSLDATVVRLLAR